MLRTLYRCVLRLHPPRFRNRFGDEMLSILDHAEKRAAFGLLLDCLVSLARQWILRPQFHPDLALANSPQLTSDFIPSFYTLRPFRPRATAVIQGLVLSTAVFCATCFAIRYSWIHLLHVRIPEVQFESQAMQEPRSNGRALLHNPAVPPPSAVKPAPAYPPATQAQPELPELQNPPENTAPNSGESSQEIITTAPKKAKPRPLVLSAKAMLPIPLQSYVGIYIVPGPRPLTIWIRAERDELMMEVVGGQKQVLVPVSSTKFAVYSTGNDWVEFLKDGDGTIDRLQLFRDGQEFVAGRQR